MLYFDHNASTPPKPGALEVLRQAEAAWGNPSSQHSEGRKARAALEESRERLGELLRVRPSELVFTSGGTESNRLAVEGAIEAFAAPGRPHAVAAGIEHPSVLEVYERLAARGWLDLTIVRAGRDGRILPAAILEALRPETRVVSLQHANNETGVLQPVEELAALLERRFPSQGRGKAYITNSSKPLLHVDLVQSLGKLPVRPADLGADLAVFSSHKLGGPKGAGGLWVRPGRGYEPPLRGGPQERRMRPGTENVPAVRGFVRAVELADQAIAASDAGGNEAGSCLRALLAERVHGVVFNGGPDHLLPNTVNASFEGVSAELLVIRLDQEGVAVSMGSACASGSREPSHVLKAMGLEPWRIQSAVRFSTGWTTSIEDVELAVEIVGRVVSDLRARAPATVPATVTVTATTARRP